MPPPPPPPPNSTHPTTIAGSTQPKSAAPSQTAPPPTNNHPQPQNNHCVRGRWRLAQSQPRPHRQPTSHPPPPITTPTSPPSGTHTSCGRHSCTPYSSQPYAAARRGRSLSPSRNACACLAPPPQPHSTPPHTPPHTTIHAHCVSTTPRCGYIHKPAHRPAAARPPPSPLRPTPVQSPQLAAPTCTRAPRQLSRGHPTARHDNSCGWRGEARWLARGGGGSSPAGVPTPSLSRWCGGRGVGGGADRRTHHLRGKQSVCRTYHRHSPTHCAWPHQPLRLRAHCRLR